MNTKMKRSLVSMGLVGTMAIGLLTGCQGRPTIFANPDRDLRKTSTQFAADSAKRFPYKTEVPRVREEKARAQAAYDLNRLEVVNFTGQDWEDVEVWVNRQYVCYVPKMEDRKLKEIHFPMLYDDQGKYFPLKNKQVRVEKVEIFRNGVLYDVTVHNADF